MGYWSRRGVYIHKQGDSVQIDNSYLIKSVSDMSEYAYFVMYKSKYRNYFAGSLVGFMYEWEVHNLAYAFASATGDTENMIKAKDLNVGPTIYDDNHGTKSIIIMFAGFRLLYPEIAEEDMKIYNMRE